MYWAPHYTRCLLRETPKHGNILNILSACLIFIGLIFDVLVLVFIKGLNIYNCKVTDLDYTPSLYSPIPQGDSTHTAAGGSPITTTTSVSRDAAVTQPTRPAPTKLPRSEITVFRQPSTLTNSSGGGSSVVEPSSTGVTYAQVVFPPDKRKPNDGTTSPKRLAVRADVPLHYLSVEDVRTQLGGLKSFNPNGADKTPPPTEEADTDLGKITGAIPKEAIVTDLNAIRPQSPERADTDLGMKTGAIPKKPIETDLDAIRPQSPETDF